MWPTTKKQIAKQAKKQGKRGPGSLAPVGHRSTRAKKYSQHPTLFFPQTQIEYFGRYESIQTLKSRFRALSDHLDDRTKYVARPRKAECKTR